MLPFWSTGTAVLICPSPRRFSGHASPKKANPPQWRQLARLLWSEHYGSGVADIPTLVSELGQGSIHNGICVGQIFSFRYWLGWQLANDGPCHWHLVRRYRSYFVWYMGWRYNPNYATAYPSQRDRSSTWQSNRFLWQAYSRRGGIGLSASAGAASIVSTSRILGREGRLLSMGNERYHQLCPSRWLPLPVRVAPAGRCFPKPCPKFYHKPW